MPIPKPGKDEEQDKFMQRCMHEASKNPDRTNEQNVAICMGAWRDRHKKEAREEMTELIAGIIEVLGKHLGDDEKWPVGHRFCPKCGYAWTVDVHKPKGDA